MVGLTFDGAVAIVRLDDPATLNAITVEVTRELRDACRTAERNARAMVLAGSDRAFSSGGNLASIDRNKLRETDFGAALEDDLNPMLLTLRELTIPWVSAIRGVAAGGGSALALAADLIVAGDSAVFVHPFLRAGLVPDLGTSFLLARTIGRPRAMELLLLGDRLPAARALEWGLINRVVPDAEVEACAFEIAARLARGPATAMRLTRRLVWEGVERGLSDCLEQEVSCQRAASADPDFEEGVTSFLDKRAPRFGLG